MGFLNFLCGGTSLMHWTHGIEDTNTLDVVGDYYLFISVDVKIQYNQRRYSKCALSEVSREEY